MKKATLVALLFCVGCNQSPKTPSEGLGKAIVVTPDENKEKPIGRYQVSESDKASGVYVLDTRDGMVSYCSYDLASKQTNCSAPTKADLIPGKPTVSNW